MNPQQNGLRCRLGLHSKFDWWLTHEGTTLCEGKRCGRCGREWLKPRKVHVELRSAEGPLPRLIEDRYR